MQWQHTSRADRATPAPGSVQARLLLAALLLCFLALALASCAPPAITATANEAAQPVTATLSPTHGRLLPAEPTTPTATRTALPLASLAAIATAMPTAGPSDTPIALVIQPTPALPALDEAQRSELFEKVWGTVAEHYLYSDFGGVDWHTIKQQYQPRALQADSSVAFYATLKGMVKQLGDEHSRFLDPQAAYQEQGLSTGEVYVGIGVATIEDVQGRLVTTVFPDSPASEAGLKRRDIIVAVDGQPVDSRGSQISGPRNTTIRLQVLDPSGEQRTVTLQRRAVLERYMPEIYLLPGSDVGYLSIQSFWPLETPQAVEQILLQFAAAHKGRLAGLIVDVRANLGGYRNVLEGLLGNFVQGEVGAFYSQSSSYPLRVTPTTAYLAIQELPVVVLVDRGTKSYAEVFAAVLQSEGRAQVVGVNTAGNTETIYPYDFQDGSRLWVAQEGFRLRDGLNLEGRGVVPDRSIPVDWLRFSERRDPHIVKGIELIHQRNAGSN